MSKSTRALVQITLSLFLAVIAGVIIFKWTNGVKQAAPTAVVENTVPVVVAKTDLGRGVKLTEDMLEIRKFTQDSRPSGAFAEVKQVEGRVLNQTVGMGDALTPLKLADKSIMGGGVSALITPGKRAMAVKGNEVMGLSGFVRPGDRVDVIVSLTVGRNEKPVTKLVLEQIKVIATGTQLTPPNEEGKVASVGVYTLELTPAESERLALASTQGTLHFALRNEQDNADVRTIGTTVPQTLAALRPKQTTPNVRRTRRNISIEIITGTNRSTVKF
ncbi:Flp pilus assembly protein CpaB [Pseudodesulfovibrio mercurii]|uniref:Flp pilus assembly protein CpaB n=1 Tax=Pseudodesulfovibrio mercurii TaxID=641491 RepID=F0JJQ6_9BACT|nr:Flp pilus assembly protein CpaB [Pseudodesulfovibrio mercurii]EGB16155.1 Flp pilus assembly protein CpaB [Pseudodesulfovibrio mercurii]